MASRQLGLILFIISNVIVCINAQYEGYPSQSGLPLQSAFEHSLELKCRYTGIDGDGQFSEWFKRVNNEDVSVNVDKPGHYVVKHTDKESTLIIRIFVEADSNVTKWFVKTKKPGFETPYECQFGQIHAISSPQGILDNQNELYDAPHASIRRTEGDLLNFKCLIQPEDKSLLNRIQWQYSRDNKTYDDLPNGVEAAGDEMHIKTIEKAHRGYYRCSLNSVDYILLLRVKDRLAALWPFLGIVGIVLVLVIIILIYEKRQASSKKSSSNDEDEQDRASDPLVRTTVKSTDNDKKRAIKA